MAKTFDMFFMFLNIKCDSIHMCELHLQKCRLLVKHTHTHTCTCARAGLRVTIIFHWWPSWKLRLVVISRLRIQQQTVQTVPLQRFTIGLLLFFSPPHFHFLHEEVSDRLFSLKFSGRSLLEWKLTIRGIVHTDCFYIVKARLSFSLWSWEDPAWQTGR